MSDLAKLVLWQFAALAVGAFLTDLTGWSAFYSIGYIISFLPLLIFWEEATERGGPLLTLVAYFGVWLLTFPVVHCLFALYGGFCHAHPAAHGCDGILSCATLTEHYRFGEDVARMKLTSFFEESEDIIEAIINIIPYALSKGVIAIAGLNWITVIINILIRFSMHVGAAFILPQFASD